MATPNAVSLVNQVRLWAAEQGFLRSGDRVLVAVSGGPDSLALLHILWSLRAELDLDLRVASLDHGLRGAVGAADVRFVGEVAVRLGLPFTPGTVDSGSLARESGLSPEDAARRARYAFLGDLARRWDAGSRSARPPRVAVGHTADDQAETVLMRILEGTGLFGLSGMPASREEDGWVLVRPLLRVSRAEVLEYCRRHGLEPREDLTNLDPRFRRNFVRHAVLPLLASYNPRVREALVRLSDLAREETATVHRKTHRLARSLLGRQVPAGESPFAGLEPAGGRVVSVPRGAFGELDHVTRRRLVRHVVRELCGPEAWREMGLKATARAVRAIGELAVGGRLHLPGGLLLEVGYDHAFFTVAKTRKSPDQVERRAPGRTVRLEVPGRTVAGELGWSFEVDELAAGAFAFQDRDPLLLHIDPDRVAAPLWVRTRRRGDAFRPRGLGGSKKLKDFFIAAKVPRAERETWPLIVDGEDRIVWVVGLRADERFAAAGGEPLVWRIKARRETDSAKAPALANQRPF